MPVAFFDDDPGKWNTQIHGVPVLGRPELLAEEHIRADEAIIAMPSANGRRVREVVQVFNEARIRVEIVPSMEQMVNGAVKVSQIRPVEIEDLLGREPVRAGNGANLGVGAGQSGDGHRRRGVSAANFAGRSRVSSVAPDAGGALRGADLSDRAGVAGAWAAAPRSSRSLPTSSMTSGCVAFFTRFRPQVVFHAAAHKHVPMMEHQPYEAFRNNTIGTKRLAKLSVAFGVERFLMISTDKAINPTNVMGATKRLAELYIQALQNEIRNQKPETGSQRSEDGGQKPEARGRLPEDRSQTTESGRQISEDRNSKHQFRGSEAVSFAPQAQTKLMAVRFGNVLGSSGSVIPTFKKQIAAGGPVTVTHPDVTRYFMTIPEAVGLVLQSATMGQGGEIFVLDMGKRVRIVDLARQLIELSGLKPDVDIEIKYTGLRPGEKLFEETQPQYGEYGAN